MKNFDTWKEFGKYLEGLEQDDSEKKIPCSKFVVLPEKVSCMRDKGVRINYEEGALMCIAGVYLGYGRTRCSSESAFRLNEMGELEIICELNSRLVIEVKKVREYPF